MKAISSAIVIFSGVHLFHSVSLFSDPYRGMVCSASIILFVVGLVAWVACLIRRPGGD
jgi:hypothetical protein